MSAIANSLLPELSIIIWKQVFESCLVELVHKTVAIVWRMDRLQRESFQIQDTCINHYTYYHLSFSDFERNKKHVSCPASEWYIHYGQFHSNIAKAYEELLDEKWNRGEFGFFRGTQ